MAESTTAIFTAIGSNLAIAAAKFVGATLTGSASMAAEGVHSLVDTANGGLLLVGIKRAERPADERHPFGHGREVYFYAFVVAVLIFLAGGLYSLYEGVEKMRHPEAIRAASLFGVTIPGLAVNLAILGFAILAEGYSLYVALHSLPKGGGSPLSAIHRSKDPSLFVVVAEDTAAVAGLVMAALGVGLSELLHMPVLDGAASLGIGVLLVGMAAFLMAETHGLLIGEAADSQVVEAILDIVRGEPSVRHVNEILTQHLGPADVLVNLSLDLGGAGDVEGLVTRLDGTLKAKVPAVSRVFVEIQAKEASLRLAGRQA